MAEEKTKKVATKKATEAAVKKPAAPKKAVAAKKDVAVKKAATTKKADAPKKEVVAKKAAAPKKETAAKKPVAPKKAVEKKEPVAKKAAAPKKATPVKKVAKPVVEKTEKVAEKPAAKTVVAKPKAAKKAVEAKVYYNRLVKRYHEEVVPAMVKQFNYTSVMQAPRLNKIVINMGVGDATTNAKLLEDAVKELTLIAGQKPVITKAKKSEASFKLREGQSIGCKVDLRGDRMFDFLDKLIGIALPRVRDFRGISKNAFDGHGNYTLGVKEQLIFAEIDFDLVNRVRGMDIVIVTTAQTDEEAHALLSGLGMPFQR